MYFQMNGKFPFKIGIVRKSENKVRRFKNPEPPGQFHINLAQSILGGRAFKYDQMKGQFYFKEEIISNM